MHVLYDGRIYLMQAAGGINRYFQNIIERLPADDRVTMTLPVLPRVNFPTHPNLHAIVADGGSVSRALRLRRATRGLRPDIVHPTYYRMLDHSSMRRSGAPVVLTVHDMVQERYRRQLDRYGIRWEIKRRALRAADVVICVSRSTRADLLDIHPWLDERSVHVVHHATELRPDTARDESLVPQEPYVFHVGSRFWYKDFDLVLRALVLLEAEAPELVLAVAGPPFSDEERARIAELGVETRVRHVGLVDDAQLVGLYARSRALVYPSRYEGFGIPPLEAMACDTAVIAADTSSIPEVVGNAAELFEPGSLDGLVEALRRVVLDDARRDELIERGRVRRTLFSWDKAVAETRAIYDSVR